MAITIQCACGMRLAAKEESAGKFLACPNCGAKIQIPKPGGSGAAARPGAAKSGAASAFNYPTSKRGAENKGEARLALSTGAKVLIGLGIAIPLIITAIKLGPVRAMEQWRKAEPLAESDTMDVVSHALLARYAKMGLNIDKPEDMPKVTHIVVDGPIMPMTMPSDVPVQGTTTEGKFYGTYHPADRSVEARVEEFGGKTVNLKGNVKDNVITIESVSP